MSSPRLGLWTSTIFLLLLVICTSPDAISQTAGLLESDSNAVHAGQLYDPKAAYTKEQQEEARLIKLSSMLMQCEIER